MSEALPLLLDLSASEAIVTGAGASSLAAARRLASHARRVRLIAPGARPAGLPDTVTHVAETPSTAHLEGVGLVVAAGEPSSDDALVRAAGSRGIPVVRAAGIGGTAWLGAAATAHGLVVSVSSMGRSDELDARMAARLAADVRPLDGRWAEILGGLRAKLEERFPDAERRTRIWEDILDSPVAALLEAGQDDEALELAERMAWGTG